MSVAYSLVHEQYIVFWFQFNSFCWIHARLSSQIWLSFHLNVDQHTIAEIRETIPTFCWWSGVKSLVYVNVVLTLVTWRCMKEAIVTRLESKQQQFLVLSCGTTGSRAAASAPGAQSCCRGWHLDCRCEASSGAGSYRPVWVGNFSCLFWEGRGITKK